MPLLRRLAVAVVLVAGAAASIATSGMAELRAERIVASYTPATLAEPAREQIRACVAPPPDMVSWDDSIQISARLEVSRDAAGSMDLPLHVTAPGHETVTREASRLFPARVQTVVALHGTAEGIRCSEWVLLEVGAAQDVAVLATATLTATVAATYYTSGIRVPGPPEGDLWIEIAPPEEAAQ